MPAIKLSKAASKKFGKDKIAEFKKPIPKNYYNLVNKLVESSQAFRPKNIGQMSELVPEFLANNPDADHEDWRDHYNSLYPGRFDRCYEIDMNYVQDQLPKCGLIITDDFCDYLSAWCDNMVYVYNFYGFYYQQPVIEAVATHKGKNYEISSIIEESKNIDVYIGNEPYSVKPISWKEHSKITGMKIDSHIKMIYYTTKKDGIEIEYDD